MNILLIIGKLAELIKYSEIYYLLKITIKNPFYNGDLNQQEETVLPVFVDKQAFKNELNFLKERNDLLVIKARIHVLNNQKFNIYAERILII